jgi:hypothetical protein
MHAADELRKECELTNPNFKVAGLLAAEALDGLERRIQSLEAANRHAVTDEACDIRHAAPPEVRQAEEPPLRARKRK